MPREWIAARPRQSCTAQSTAWCVGEDAGAQVLAQRAANEQLRHDEGTAIPLADVEHHEHVRMGDDARELRFPVESAALPRLVRAWEGS